MDKANTRKPDTSNQERIIQLVHLLKTHQPIPFKDLMDRLEVSRATLRRDFDILRDRLNMPVIYDRWAGGYCIDENQAPIGEKFELPGLWLNIKECYALLTLFNVLHRIDPGMLFMYISPLRLTIKRLLCLKSFSLRGFDRKIAIELNDFENVNQRTFSELSQALNADKRVELEFIANAPLINGEYSLQRYVLTANGWNLDAISHFNDSPVRFPAASVKTVKILNMSSR